MNEQRIVLNKERLRERVEGQGRGIVFENPQSYRRAVDERLFRLGEKRYEALMDTLIQLRQPQLSRKPDEVGLSQALTEALPPMPQELLADVAEALNQLEEDREQLDRTRQLEQAVTQFEKHYRLYASVLTRRQAREMRQAQTAFDNASDERNKAQSALREQLEAEAAATQSHELSKRALTVARERLETLQSDPANQDANRLSQAERDFKERGAEAARAVESHSSTQRQLIREQERSRASNQRADAAQGAIPSARAQCVSEAQPAGLAAVLSGNILSTDSLDELAVLPDGILTSAMAELRTEAQKRRDSIRLLEQRHAAVALKQSTLQSLQATQRECQEELEGAKQRRAEADQKAEAAGGALVAAWTAHCAELEQLRFGAEEPLSLLPGWVARPEEGPNPLQVALIAVHRKVLEQHATLQVELEAQRRELKIRRTALMEEQQQVAPGQDAAPPIPATRSVGVRQGREGAPFWQLVDFQPHVSTQQRAGLEASLEACGLLDAWIAADGSVTAAGGSPIWDTQWRERAAVGNNLLSFLWPVIPEGSPIEPSLVNALLAGISCGPEDDPSVESWIAEDGRFRLGSLAGAWQKPEAVYVGQTARAQARQRRLREIAQELQSLDEQAANLSRAFGALAINRATADEEMESAPSDNPLRQAILDAASAGREAQQARNRLEQADRRCQASEDDLFSARAALNRDAIDLQLPAVQAVSHADYSRPRSIYR